MKKIILSLLMLITGFNVKSQTLTFDTEQYKKALWMTTRFYGAQRMGEGSNWLLHRYNYSQSDAPDWLKQKVSQKDVNTEKSFLKDADGDYDLTGGWFDCGDFCLFGQTFYYSAYMLLLGYSEFTSGYDDLYSADYMGYFSSGKFNWENKKGKTNKIPDILDECKYATDFILKAVRDENTFYYEKGNGNADHSQWCTSVIKSGLTKADGGESDGARDFAKASSNVTSMAALAGASLAAMYRLYMDFDVAYALKCLPKAETAYKFATETALGNSGSKSGDFYPGKEKFYPDLTILCAEMYRATKNKTYLEKCEYYTKEWIDNYNHGWVLNYNNTEDIALYAYCAALGENGQYYEKAKNALKNIVNNYPSANNVLRWDGWGALRYVANEAFSWALYSKLSGETAVNEKVLRTVEYILGNNTPKFSYIVGINGFGTDNFPKNPHHRNFYRSDAGDENTAASKLPSNYGYIQFGYLVGGSSDDGAYDASSSYTVREGGIDYNCGLVGALGYIVEKIAPATGSNAGTNATVAAIKLKSAPKKTVYNVGEKLDVSGGVITVVYSDNTQKDFTVTENMISGFSTKKGGKFTVTISYSGKSTTYLITVQKTATGMKVYPWPQTEYLMNEPLNLAGSKVMIVYNDGSLEEETALTEDMISGFSTQEYGTSTVTVTYSDWTFPLTITVLASPVAWVELYKMPAKTVYYQDEALEVSGGRVHVHYEDGGEDVLDLTEQMVKNFDSSVPGNYILEISYGGQSVNYEIEVLRNETPVETVKKNPYKIFSFDHTVKIENWEGRVEIFNISGRKVFSGLNTNEIHIEKQGIYIVKIGNFVKKVAIF